ncbi:hypothetical protein Vretifemale_20235 [Volvox reticuliferus]|uniref:Uncharacterized protein n=1 Tax=Volvox reticuliferus TaxID=1737510 RepID=A0A8J4D641_9CHLO|nr:hypothetical protein Vretifemale_20235 [Volvox reticuliferus]
MESNVFRASSMPDRIRIAHLRTRQACRGGVVACLDVARDPARAPGRSGIGNDTAVEAAHVAVDMPYITAPPGFLWRNVATSQLAAADTRLLQRRKIELHCVRPVVPDRPPLPWSLPASSLRISSFIRVPSSAALHSCAPFSPADGGNSTEPLLRSSLGTKPPTKP